MKLTSIAMALVAIGTINTNTALADTDDAQNVHKIIPGKEKIKIQRANKTRNDSLYYVVLEDSPLTSYSGGVTGLSATSINSSANITSRGLIDVKSSLSKKYKSYLQTKQDSFTAKATRLLKRQLKVKHNYKVVLNAVASEMTAAEAKLLAKQPEVRSVEKVGMHYLHTASGPEFVGAKNVWSGINDYVGTQGENVIVGIIDTGINASHASFADIGGDGYDHTNPLGEGNYLGDCQTYSKFCNDKLIGIISYDTILESRPTVLNEDFDDLTDKLAVGYDFQGHGSHVASTAAGNILKDVNYYLSVTDDEGTITQESGFNFPQISGVAPHANLVAYQVCDDDGACWPELTVLAIEHAIENNVNVLNYSVGGSSSDPWTSTDALAFLNARAAGIHVATTAGNSGPDATTIGSPGNAPWVTTTAAFTHDRGFSDKSITGFSGGNSLPVTDITGKAATAGITANVVMAEDFGDAQCLTPFAENTFSGQIVVCERGDIARVRKGLNVQEGGAGGLILMNIDDDENSLVADNHLLPAIHINVEDGKALVAWLSEGENHSATITASDIESDPALADIAGSFSSRGPNAPYQNIFSPDIAAPGVGVYAAYAEDAPFVEESTGVPFASLDGTSMASPHVAGALALIYSVHPTWTPAQVQSALMSTASQLTYTDDDGDGVTERADFFAQGAGSLRVNKAITAGLLLDITEDEYLNADPYLDGEPATLNSTSMVNSNCITTCTWTRTVEAVKDSKWTASYEYLTPGFDLSVEPASFELKAGETQELTITANANIELVDEWVHGYINLDNADEAMSDTHLQATIGFSAGVAIDEVSASLNNVTKEVVIADVLSSGSNDLQVNGFGLFKATSYIGTAKGAVSDSEQASPSENTDTLFSKSITVRPYTKRLIAEITNSTAPDMDLYVGIDEDGDGLPSYYEIYYSLACMSGNENSSERCVVENPVAGTYWVFAHNFEGSDAELDDVTIEIAQVSYTDSPTFDIIAPTTVAENSLFDVTLSVNGYLNSIEQLEPLNEGDVYYGLVELGSTATLKRNIGQTLIKVTGIENEEVNTAPVVKTALTDVKTTLTTSGSVSVSIDASDVFMDAEDDTITLELTGADGITIEDGQISGSLTEAGVYNFTLSATDGELTTSTTFSIEVEAAPVTVTPTVPTEPAESSGGSGGSTGFLWLSLVALIMYRRKVTV